VAEKMILGHQPYIKKNRTRAEYIPVQLDNAMKNFMAEG
jgi:hypothetical protein